MPRHHHLTNRQIFRTGTTLVCGFSSKRTPLKHQPTSAPQPSATGLYRAWEFLQYTIPFAGETLVSRSDAVGSTHVELLPFCERSDEAATL